MSDWQQTWVEEFYQQQHQALIQFLQSKLGSAQEAYDVAQETYERLLRNENTPLINNPKAFVFRVANNLAIDRIRQRKLRGDDQVGDFDGNELISSSLSPDEQIENELMVAMVRVFISELPAKCRSAFLYYKFEEREYAEIAELLGVTESMIRKYVLRAMVYCRERFDQCNQDLNSRSASWQSRQGD